MKSPYIWSWAGMFGEIEISEPEGMSTSDQTKKDIPIYF